MEIGTYEASNRANAKAIRDRLMNSKPVKVRQDRRLLDEIEALKEENEAVKRSFATFELDIADLQATILHQAIRICEMEGVSSPEPTRRSAKAIIADVLTRHPDITYEDIVGRRRARIFVEPRHACMKAVYEERKDLSLPQIGRIFGRDHTTVLHAIGRLNRRK